MKYRKSLFDPELSWCDNDKLKKIWTYVGDRSIYNGSARGMWGEMRARKRMGLHAPIMSMLGNQYGGHENPFPKDSLETMASRIILW